MHSPLRTESDAFRFVVIIGMGAVAVIALAVATEPVYGVVLAAVLLGVGIGVFWRAAQGSEHKAEIVGRSDDGRHRILVVANETVGGRALLEEIRNRVRGRRCEILVVTPALTRSQLQHWVSDVDEAVAEAERRRTKSVRAIEAEGLEVSGEVGDSDPNAAIESALLRFPADELIISTHPPQRSRWLERGVVDKARAEVDLPITHVVVDLEAERVAAST